MNDIKIYTDATVKNNQTGIGYVIYNNNNNSIICEEYKTIDEWRISQAELKAVIESIIKVKNKYSPNNIKVFTDNHSIVDIYKGYGKPREDTMQGLLWRLNKKSENINLKIEYVKSENNIADDIARRSICLE